MPDLKQLPSAPDLHTQVMLLTHPERNAWWLAEACWLAYQDDDAVKAVYRNRVQLECDCLCRGGTQCTIASSPEFAIVALRGTQPDQWADMIANGRYLPITWQGVVVHRGFAAALDAVWDPLTAKLAALPPTVRIWVTGHSLGAAPATLAAFRLTRESAVYAFGSPLIGTKAFAGLFNARFGGRAIRYVNDHDVVTRVPPAEFAIPHGRYTHVDVLRWIDADGTVRPDPPPAPRFFSSVFGSMAIRLHLFEPPESTGLPGLSDALRDHTPLHYVIHAWNDLVRSGSAAVAGSGGPACEERPSNRRDGSA